MSRLRREGSGKGQTKAQRVKNAQSVSYCAVAPRDLPQYNGRKHKDDARMTRIPDFSTLALDPTASAPAPAFAAEFWQTPEGIAVKSVYGPEDVEGCRR